VRAELMAAGHGETAGQATLRQARGPGRPADAMRS
jgi:hypothetical protein